MKFGIPTLIERAGVEESVALAGELGLDFVELNMNLPEYQPDTMDVSRLRTTAEQNGIFFTLHLDENLNFCDWNEEVRTAYLRTALRSVEIARQIAAPVVNLHLSRGVYFTMPDRRIHLFRQYRDRYLAHIRVARDALASAAGGEVLISVENTDGFLDFQLEALEILLESPAFALTYDAGHDFSAGGVDGRWMLRHDKLRHMHLHDAVGSKNHLPLGSGQVDAENLLSLAKEKKISVVLETKTVAGLSESVAYLRKKGYI